MGNRKFYYNKKFNKRHQNNENNTNPENKNKEDNKNLDKSQNQKPQKQKEIHFDKNRESKYNVKPKDSDRRRRFFKSKPPYNKQKNEPRKQENIVYEICPFCEKEIREPLYALKDKESGKNVHFECIQKRVASSLTLAGDEKLYYLGSGNFGIVKEKRQFGKNKIMIIQRVQYEEKKQ